MFESRPPPLIRGSTPSESPRRLATRAQSSVQAVGAGPRQPGTAGMYDALVPARRRLPGLLLALILGCALAGCGCGARADLADLATRMCACEDLACVRALQDEAPSTPSLMDLADPAVFEARFGDDADAMASLARWQQCSSRFVPAGP